MPNRPRAQRSLGLTWGAAAIFTLTAAIVPAVIRPGDVPWTNDEPTLIIHAAQANRGMWIVNRGLTGSLGLSYGPLPTQIYQVLLLLTHDPCKLVALRGALCAGVTGLSLLWLAWTLRLSPWFAAAVCLAPNVYLFHRILWDATFIVPLGALSFAAYASFLRSGSRRSLLLMLGAACSLPLIHPQTLPLSAALIGHLLWRHGRTVWKHRAAVLAVIIGIAALNAGYLRYAIVTVLTHGSELVRTGQGTKISPFRAAFTPLLGGEVLCGDPFAGGDSRLGSCQSFIGTARLLARGIHAMVWMGIAVTALRVIRSAGRPRRPRAFPPPAVLWGMGKDPAAAVACDGPRDELLRIALVALLLQMALYAAIRVPPMVSYYFGPFPITVLFAWTGIEAFGRLRLRGALVAVFGLCVGTLTCAGAWQVHRFGWPRGSMSPTLANQVEVARALNAYSDTWALTNVGTYQEYSHALSTLRYLLPPPPGAHQTHSGRLLIRYRTALGDTDGRIELSEAQPGDEPPHTRRVSVSPPR